MNETLAYVKDINCRLSAVTPHDLTCLTEVLLIVGKDNEVVEGCDCTAPRGKRQVRGLPPWFRAAMRWRRRHVGCQSGVISPFFN